jgi:hypothetical protein
LEELQVLYTGTLLVSFDLHLIEQHHLISTWEIARWAHQLLELNWPHDPNMRYGFPTLSNTDDWNTILGPDGKMWTAIMIHPWRNPTGEGGESEGCLIPNLEDYKKLLPMLCDQYNNGGFRLHKMP